MNLYQTLSMAMKSIFNNKVRSILTMLGIIIGVSSVITLVAVVQGMQAQIMEQFNSMGKNKINLEYYGGSYGLVNDMVAYAKEDLKDYVMGICPNAQTNLSIKFKSKSVKTNLYFANESFDLCNDNKIASGRAINYSDVKGRTKVCVIGETIRKSFFGAMNPINQKLKINGQEYVVVGTYEATAEGQKWSGDDKVVVPLSLQRTITGSTSTTSYVVKAKDGDSVQKFIDKITAYMKPKIKNEWDFSAYSATQWQKEAEQSTNMMTLVAGGIAGISLLVGGIGIMNIMLVSVTERTREIGIRMAIGAKRRDIISQFLIEAAAVSAFGGLIGIALGFFGSALLGAYALQELCLPRPPLVAGAFLFSAILGIVFGLYPANKASKLQPVDALRTQ